MSMKNPRSLALAAAVLAAGLATASLAQTPPPASRPPAEGHGMGRMDMDPAARAEQRAQHLRAALQLRPDQEPALRALMASMKPPEGLREKMRGRRAEMAGLTTPERLDRMRARMGERQAAFDQRAAAIKRFYAALSPSQQKAFDAMGPMKGRMGGMGGHGRMGRGMGHGGHGGHEGPGADG